MSLIKNVVITGLLHCAIFFRIYTWGNQRKNEVDVVAYYANQLHISEYELFKQAAEASGSSNHKHTLNDFICYLKHESIPFYVRWYLVNLKTNGADTNRVTNRSPD